MRSSVRGLVLVAACIVGTFAALGVPEVAAAALIVVDNTEDFPDSDPGDGHCRGALRYAVLNRCSLRAAIQEANATPGIDNIVLEGKTYSLAQNPETPGVPGPDTITASVTITGIGRDSTTIDLGGSANIPRWRIQGFSTTARFIGLTISRGNGIIGDAGTTTFLTSSRVDRARTSGVINSVLATMTITNSVISNSQNGVGLDSAGTLTVDATSIVGNRNTTTTDPSSDGGVTINAGSATITNTVIANNTSAVQGGAGGISNRGSVLIVSSLIANNTATSSNGIGGVKNLGVMPIANSTISSNLGGLFGGISAESGPIGLVSSTVASNSPGGFRVAGGFVTGMQNVLLAQNAIQNCTGPVSVFPDPQQQQNFDSDGTCAFPPGTNFTGNPLLGPLASNGGPSQTHALLAGSPAIDVANCQAFFGTIATDQRGVARPLDGNGDTIRQCDIGAFEFLRVTLPLPIPGVGSVAPREGSTGVNRRFTQTVTWDVPGPENWNVLGTIDYRLRADGRVVFWLRWDQATNLFQLLDANGNPAGPQFSGGTPFLLGNDLVRLDLEGTEGRGSGPTGLRATLTLPLLFADALNGKTLTVELSGTNDFGAVDQFRQVGSIAVGAGQGAGPVGANNDAHEDEGGRVRQDKDDHRPPSEQAQRERERTNRSGKSDVSIEGNVVAVEKAPELNSLLVTVALTRDEIQVVQVPCSGSAGAVECYDIRVGDYLEADGYQHGVGDRDDFFVASDGIEVTRDGRKVK